MDMEFTEEDGRYLHLYLEELEGLPAYTDEEIREAKVRAISGDDEMQEVLLNHYLGAVVGIAKIYLQQGLPAEDLIGEGNIGLMTALGALGTLDNAEEVDGFVSRLIMDAMEEAIYEEAEARRHDEDYRRSQAIQSGQEKGDAGPGV